MRLKIEWTTSLVSQLLGSLVTQSKGEGIGVLCWDQADGVTRVWSVDSRDGMLYHYGTVPEAADKLNKNGVMLYHRKEKVSVDGGLA